MLLYPLPRRQVADTPWPMKKMEATMKTMTCTQLGGACDLAFHAETFDEIAVMSRRHGMEMAQKQDAAHLAAMERMRALMQDPAAMEAWMSGRRAAFDALPDEPPSANAV